MFSAIPTLSTLGRWASRALSKRKPWTLKDFSNPRFERISASQPLEEENLPDFAARFYPLGFGLTSTVWLARDLTGCRHVALIFIRSSSLGDEVSWELSAYQRLAEGPFLHPGRIAVRALLDSFTISGPNSEQHCLVHPPLWDSVKGFLARNPIGRLPIPVLAVVLREVFFALAYARECQVIHTDIKAANIMFSIEDPTVFPKFEQAELDHPTPRKEVDGRIIYQSRELEIPSELGLPVLCDLGSAAWGEEKHEEDVQPNWYRSPEVILGVPWSYEIDLWNVGCVIWDIFEGTNLFDGTDPEHEVYRGRAHLAEMITLLGPPPSELVARGALRSKFFSEQGEFQAGIEVPSSVSLGQLETNLEGSDKELFLKLMNKMLQWDPQNRHTAEQLFLEDE